MPELPEVETVLRGLRARALGQRINALEVRNPLVLVGPADDFTRNVTGRWVSGLARKGKALAIELTAENPEAPQYLLLRLGMTGQFTVARCEAPLEPHTHVRLVLEGGQEELRYRDTRRFGRLRCCTREELEAVFAGLGPDALEVREDQFLEKMRGRTGAIKSWLMNQQVLAGVGNIYADEALFEARIHPLAQPGRVSRRAARRLYRAVRKVLGRAVAFQGTSVRDYIDIEGRPGGFRRKLRVYQRTGEPCPRCRRAIRRVVISGRSTHFCPRCQLRPRYLA